MVIGIKSDNNNIALYAIILIFYQNILLYHLCMFHITLQVKPSESGDPKEGNSKMVSEIYLTRMLAAKVYLLTRHIYTINFTLL